MPRNYSFTSPMTDSEITRRDQGECPRKSGLKRGIRQLKNDQIIRTFEFEGRMALDHGNYVDGMMCPLAIGVGLDRMSIMEPTNDRVSAILTLAGYKVNNTRGIAGSFYRENRGQDYFDAACEVLAERGVVIDKDYSWPIKTWSIQ